MALLLGYEVCFNYNPTAPIREDILDYSTGEATKKSQARFLRNAANRIRSRRCRGYEECYRNLARSNGRLRIALERALLTHDVLVSSSLFDSQNLLRLFRNLIYLFVSVLRNVLYFSAWIRYRITALVRHLSSFRKTKPTCFNLSRSVI